MGKIDKEDQYVSNKGGYGQTRGSFPSKARSVTGTKVTKGGNSLKEREASKSDGTTAPSNRTSGHGVSRATKRTVC